MINGALLKNIGIKLRSWLQDIMFMMQVLIK